MRLPLRARFIALVVPTILLVSALLWLGIGAHRDIAEEFEELGADLQTTLLAESLGRSVNETSRIVGTTSAMKRARRGSLILGLNLTSR